MGVGGAWSRYGYEALPHRKIQDHATTIAKYHCLEILAIPVPVDHTMMDILDNVDPMLVIPGSIPLAPEGFTHPSKLSETIYSLPASVMESVMDLKW